MLLSRLIRLQPLGGLIEPTPDRRASTEATRTSPLATAGGRRTVRFGPNPEVVTTSAMKGCALSAGPDPATVTPSTSPNARNEMCRRNRASHFETMTAFPLRARLFGRSASLGELPNTSNLLMLSSISRAERHRALEESRRGDGPFHRTRASTASWALALGDGGESFTAWTGRFLVNLQRLGAKSPQIASSFRRFNRLRGSIFDPAGVEKRP